jgi:hypothetical protein
MDCQLPIRGKTVVSRFSRCSDAHAVSARVSGAEFLKNEIFFDFGGFGWIEHWRILPVAPWSCD